MRVRIYLFIILGACIIGVLGFVAFTFVERENAEKRCKEYGQAGYLAMTHVQPAQAQKSYESAVSEAKKIDDTMLYINMLSDLCDAYLANSSLPKAQPCLTELISDCKKQLSIVKDPSVKLILQQKCFAAQAKLANVMRDQGNLDQAYTLYKEALKGEDDALGSTAVRERIYRDYAVLLHKLGRNDEANRIELDFASSETSFHEQFDGAVDVFNHQLNIGPKNGIQGKLAEALKKFEIANLIATHHQDKESIAHATFYCGLCHFGLGQDVPAEAQIKQACELIKGSRSPLEPQMLLTLASLLEIEGKDAEARKYAKKALAVVHNDTQFGFSIADLYEKRAGGEKAANVERWLNSYLPDNSLVKADVLGRLAATLANHNQREQAALYWRQTVSIYRQNHATARGAFYNHLWVLATNYELLKQWDKAETAWREALVVAPADQRTAVISSIITDLRNQNKFIEAGNFRQQNLSKIGKTSGATKNELALAPQSNLEETESTRKEELAQAEKKCGAESEATTAALNALAAFYDERRDFALSEPLRKRIVAIREKKGDFRPIIFAQLALADNYRAQGRFQEAAGIYDHLMSMCVPHYGASSTDLTFLTIAQAKNLAYCKDYSRSMSLFERGRWLCRKHENKEAKFADATILAEEGKLLHMEGKYNEAVAVNKEALPAIQASGVDLQEQGIWCSIVNTNLANDYKRLGNNVESDRACGRAIAALRGVSPARATQWAHWICQSLAPELRSAGADDAAGVFETVANSYLKGAVKESAK